MSNETQKVSLHERAFYGFGDLASCLFWMTIMTQLLFFYTDVFGLAPQAAAWMFLISRILDAFFDVVIGMAADRTKSRWGKFRPYILFGAVPLAVSAVLAFTTPDFAYGYKIIYAYATFIAFMFLYSTVNIPYTSLLGVISSDPVERTSASSFKFIGAFLAGIIVSATVLPFAAHFGQGNVQKGWQTTMGIYAVAAVIFLMITFISTRERIQPIAKEKTSVGKDLLDLSKNIPWMMLFIVTILFILFVCIRMSVTSHYFKYYVGEQESPLLAVIFNFFLKYTVNPVYSIFGKPAIALFEGTHKFSWETLASAFNTIGQTLSLIGVLLVPFFAKMVGRKSATVFLFVVSLICTGAFYFFKPQDLMMIYVFQTIGSFVGGPISALLWVLYADTADYSEWKTGRRATGLVFSASIMSNKLGWAFGSWLTAKILQSTGYVADQVQNADVLNGLKAMMSVIPVGVGIIALIMLMFFYKLDEKTMANVKTELDERRNASNKGAATA
jgi:GPH family glycoside/pentoside/hexuronide:cation symporter